MKKILISLIGVLFISACSVVRVSTDYDPSIKIEKFKTYAIIPFEYGDSLVNNRIDAAIKNELFLKSYKMVDEDKADFLVLYRYTSVQKVETTTDYVGGGLSPYGRYGGYYSTSTYLYTQGNFEIRMADVKNKDTFWRAEGVNTLKSYDTPQERTIYTNEIVQEMLKKYPKIN